MTKMLRVTMSDGSKWDIPAEYLARERATYYADSDAEKDGLTTAERDQVYMDELAYTLSADNEIIDWASNNTDWSDVEAYAIPVKASTPPDYADDWTNADKEVVEVAD